MTSALACPLCTLTNQHVLWSDRFLHILAVNDSGFPGYTRVVWAHHQAEMTDLTANERAHLMETVWLVEQAQRDILLPDKVNLAQLGNRVPHVHWHVIPRWQSDTHFPEAIWAHPSPAGLDAERAEYWQHEQQRLLRLLPDYYARLLASVKTLA